MSDLHSTEAFEERAAIREFDGGFERSKAERLAKVDMLALEAKHRGARRKWGKWVNHDGGRN